MMSWCGCTYKINMLIAEWTWPLNHVGLTLQWPHHPFPINALIYKPIATLGSEPKQKIQPWGVPLGQSGNQDMVTLLCQKKAYSRPSPDLCARPALKLARTI